jgi:hypothetical protein
MAQNLSRLSQRTVRALIEVAKPRRPDFDLPLEDEMLEFLDGFVKYFPPHMKILFPLGLLLLEYGTFIFMGRLKPFSKLPLEEREKYVQGWVESKIPLRRDLIKGVKGLCVASFYSNHQVMDHIGYDIEDHLRKVNGVDGPARPANIEARDYFKKLHERGEWGYDNYSGAFIREPLKPTSKLRARARKASAKKAQKGESGKAKAKNKTGRRKK